MAKPSLCVFLLLLYIFALNSSSNSRVKRSVVGFGKMVSKLTNRNPLDYYRYGNWCGLGGNGPPVDGVDRCCKVHDECYGEHNRYPECQSVIFNIRAYFSAYYWDYDDESNEIACGTKNKKCRQILCECDKKCAECFAKNVYHPHYKRTLFRRSISAN